MREGDNNRRTGRDNPPAAPTLRAMAAVARRADVMHRQAKDRDSRELETPVDRMTMIRRVARKLAAQPAMAPRIAAGFRNAPAPRPLPANPAEARLARLRAAIDFLQGRAILVQVINREALVREYRISGSTHRYYADGVIAHAGRQGFEG